MRRVEGAGRRLIYLKDVVVGNFQPATLYYRVVSAPFQESPEFLDYVALGKALPLLVYNTGLSIQEVFLQAESTPQSLDVDWSAVSALTVFGWKIKHGENKHLPDYAMALIRTQSSLQDYTFSEQMRVAAGLAPERFAPLVLEMQRGVANTLHTLAPLVTQA